MSRLWFGALLVLACAQLAGIALDSPILRGLALASAASPAPKVFTTSRGLESFSSRYLLSYRAHTGAQVDEELTPERYARLQGPYNRRNVYGALISFAPVLAAEPALRPMFVAMVQRAVCSGQLLAELGLPAPNLRMPFRLLQRPREGTNTKLALSVELSCP